MKGLTLSDLELGVSIVRNRGLASVFYRLGLIEAYGTGIPKIRECYAGSPRDAQIQVSDNAFKIILPKLGNPEAADSAGKAALTKQERAALELFQKGSLVARRAVEECLAIGLTSANRLIKSLEEKGLVEQVGRGRSTRYRLVGE